jgi:hypothetical protein
MGKESPDFFAGGLRLHDGRRSEAGRQCETDGDQRSEMRGDVLLSQCSRGQSSV